jgi:hypothetical protein
MKNRAYRPYGNLNEEMNYQGNILPRLNAEDGNEVLVIATCYRWENGVTVETEPADYAIGHNLRLIRIPYKKSFGVVLGTKLRNVDGLYERLAEFEPDVILLHGVRHWLRSRLRTI